MVKSYPYQQSNASSTESSTPTFRSKQSFFNDRIQQQKKNSNRTPSPGGRNSSSTTSAAAPRISPSAQNNNHLRRNGKSNDISPASSSSTTSSNNNKEGSASGPQHASFVNMNSNDKMSLVRDGPDATIQKLRKDLNNATERDTLSKSALAKSDAVILELRSSVRQLKRELEKKEKEEQNNGDNNSNVTPKQARSDSGVSGVHSGEIGELQIQLDRAHAQILTSDMVRKELEDTLEAEQYTWELRVQDQDRTISMLEKDRSTVQNDLDQLRSQWTEAEEGWTKDLKNMRQQLDEAQRQAQQQRKLSTSRNGIVAGSPRSDEKIATLEREKGELQVCLNEAMAELEAVDQEIRSAQGWEAEREELMKENERLANLAGVQVEVGRNKRFVEFAENIDDNSQRSPNNSNTNNDSPPLKHLVNLNKWLQERPVESDDTKISSRSPVSYSNDPDVIVQNVKDYVEYLQLQLASSEVGIDDPEQMKDLKEKNHEMETEIKLEKQRSQELRESLQEAVSLLKPLQEVVDDSEKEKEALRKQLEELRDEQQQQGGSKSSSASDIATQKELQAVRQDLQNREDQIHNLEDQVKDLEEQLRNEEEKRRQQKLAQPSNKEGLEKQQHVESNERLQNARQELKSKRASEAALKVMLREAQDQFNQLNHDKDMADMERKALHEKLRSAQEELQNSPERQNAYVAKIRKLEQEIQGYDEELKFLETELAATKEELDEAKQINQSQSYESLETIERELAETKKNLKKKSEQERILTKSLKKALHLVQPMQEFVETAEKEKKKLARELKAAKKKISHMEKQNAGNSGDGLDGSMLSPSMATAATADGGESTTTSHTDQNDKVRSELEKMVQDLSEENQRLHHALDNVSLSLSLNPDEVSHLDGISHDKLKEHISELKRRYEITKQRLEHSNGQQQNLLSTLREKDQRQKDVENELRSIKKNFKKSEEELANAKFIATSALIKVEEMTMAAVQNDIAISRSHEATSDIGAMGPDSNGGMNGSKSGGGMNGFGGGGGMNGFGGGGGHTAFSPMNGGAGDTSSNDLRQLLQKVETLEREVADQRSLNLSLQESLRGGGGSITSGYQSSNPNNISFSSRDPSWSPNRQHGSTVNSNIGTASLLGGDASQSWDESFGAGMDFIQPLQSQPTSPSRRLRHNTTLPSDGRFLT